LPIPDPNTASRLKNDQERDAAQITLRHARSHPKKGITIMKKLMFALITAVLLHAPSAKAAYVGTFTANSFYSFEIIAGGSVEWAVTFTSIVRGRLQVDNFIAGSGNFPVTNIPVPIRADRVLLLIDTRNGSAQIRVNGGVLQEVIADPEARLVADVFP
jgi:hypothetical protein